MSADGATLLHAEAAVDAVFRALVAAAPARLAAWLDAHGAAVAARIYTGWTVPITRTGADAAVFNGPIRLYRLLDSFERDSLADAFAASPDATFTGGLYNTTSERVGGAAFGSLPLNVARFELRGSRLKPPLYLVEVEGNGLPFVHIMLNKHARDGAIYALGGSTGLGFNVRPRVRAVLRAWEVDPKTRALRPIDWLTLLDAHRTGTTRKTLDAMRAYDAGWTYFDTLVDAARGAERDDPWSGKKRFWTAWRKDEAVRELDAWAGAIAKIARALPGYTGLDTYEHNIIRRLPVDLQRAFKAAHTAARKREQTGEGNA